MAAVSPKVLEGARKALARHDQHSQQENPGEAAYPQAMIAHYRLPRSPPAPPPPLHLLRARRRARLRGRGWGLLHGP